MSFMCVTGKLKVLQAWDETYEGNPEGDSGHPTSLHFEGRAAKLQISGLTDEESFETLSWLAICSGMDYVANRGAHVILYILNVINCYSDKK